jgi:membrane fusion protein (multidrug efflux system)
MNIKEIYGKLKSYGVFMFGVGSLATFIVLLIVLKLLERPVKHVCEYILKEDRAQMLSGEDRIVPVEVCIAEIKPMTKRIETTGNLRANSSIIVKSEMPGGQGRIKKIHFEAGMAVKKCDLLLEFEDADFKARVSNAKAELEIAELDFSRSEQLFKQKLESQKKYDEAKAKVSVAKGRLEEAEANLQKTKIIAPFNGIAGIIPFSEGATIQNNQDLFKLVDETPMKVEFTIPERNVHDVGVGQNVEVKVDAFKDRIFKGVVAAVDSAISTDTHSLNVVASIPNEQGQLRQGLFCNVSIITGEQGDVLQVDETAVQLLHDKEIVYVVEKGRAFPVQIIRGYSENGKVEIKAGLTPGKIVVTAGQLKGGGEKVKITNLSDDILNMQVAKITQKETKEIVSDGSREIVKVEQTTKEEDSSPQKIDENKKVEQAVEGKKE